MRYEGDLVVTKENSGQYKDLVEVAGYLSINSEAKLDAPTLQSVGGYLSIYGEAKLDAPTLQSVGDSLSINSEAKLDALQSVGGNLYIYSEAKLDALQSVGGDLYINSEAKLDAPFDTSKCMVVDGTPALVLSEKKQNDVIIKRCKKPKLNEGVIIGVGDVFYIASDENNNAHGDTIKEAIAELHFKSADRDVSQYKNMPLDTVKKPDEWALIYRMITGACRVGTRMFMDNKKLKESYSLQEIINETSEAYGNAEFRKVVMGEAS